MEHNIKNAEKIQKRRNRTHIIIVSVVLVLVFPVLLQIPLLNEFCVWYLSGFNNIDYKACYLQSLVTIIGTFIAVFGALWVSRKQEQENNLREKKELGVKLYHEISNSVETTKKLFLSLFGENDIKEEYFEDKFDVLRKEISGVNEIIYVNSWEIELIKVKTLLNPIDIMMIERLNYNLKLIQNILNKLDLLSDEEHERIVEQMKLLFRRKSILFDEKYNTRTALDQGLKTLNIEIS